MRIDYTLPALEPAISPDVSAPQPETMPSFRGRLHSPSVALPSGWEEQLRLGDRPFTASYIGPPPRPRTLETSDAESERFRWRNMLWRHAAPPANEPDSGSDHGPVGGMMNMLLQMQQMEDAIVAQSVAVTRG
jgi:hypothetical protein